MVCVGRPAGRKMASGARSKQEAAAWTQNRMTPTSGKKGRSRQEERGTDSRSRSERHCTMQQLKHTRDADDLRLDRRALLTRLASGIFLCAGGAALFAAP